MKITNIQLELTVNEDPDSSDCRKCALNDDLCPDNYLDICEVGTYYKLTGYSVEVEQ